MVVRVGSVGFSGSSSQSRSATKKRSRPSTSAGRIAERQAKVQQHKESFAKLTTEQIKDVQAQQSAQKKQVEIKKQQQAQSSAKTKALEGLSTRAKQEYLSKATPSERAELTRDSDVSLMSGGSEGTIRIKYNDSKATRLETYETKRNLNVSKAYMVGESRQPVQISEKKTPIKKTKVSDLSYGQFVERELEREYKDIYYRGDETGAKRKLKELKESGKWKEMVFSEKWGTSFKYYPQYQMEKIPGVTPFVKGYRSEIREHPYRTAALTGAAFIVPGAIGLIGKGVTAVAPTSAMIISKVAPPLLGTYYGSTIISRVGKEKGFEARAEKIGRITGGEITPMLAGGYLGSQFWSRAGGWWRTRGRTEISQEQLVPKDVLKGGKTFPEAPPKEHYKIFMEESQRIPGIDKPTMFHATGKTFWKKGGGFETVPGSSEIPGLYGAPGVSPHFLRLGAGKTSFYSSDLFSPYGKPSVAAIVPKGFVTGKTAPKDFGFIPGIKTEVEAILPPGTLVSPLEIPSKYYFKWEGVRVPIDTFKTGLGLGAEGTGGALTIGEVSSSYVLSSEKPILTGGSIIPFTTQKSSYKETPTKKDYGYTYKESSKEYPREEISIVREYKRSPTSSYKPSYKPSSYISKVEKEPSYVSPYKEEKYSPKKESYRRDYFKEEPFIPPPYHPTYKKPRRIMEERKLYIHTPERLPSSLVAQEFGIFATKKQRESIRGSLIAVGGIRPMLKPTKKKKKTEIFGVDF